MDLKDIKIAYFTAEIGIKDDIKTYSGGLGILAGDIIKSMADLNKPACCVTLLYKFGFFKQKIEGFDQIELDEEWDFKKYLDDLNFEVKVNIKGENVFIKVWKYDYIGILNHKVPIFFLDTNLDKNPPWAREITNRLYRGDRLAQEIVLGIGGFRALEQLNIKPEKYHMNEGHSSFLTLELYKKIGLETGNWSDNLVRNKCVFTTHTPIPAGHDKFEYELIYNYLKEEENIIPLHLKTFAGENKFNTTRVAMHFSSYINAVSRKHKEVTIEMFPEYKENIDYITNGVHLNSWVCEEFQNLYDSYIPGWREENFKLDEVFKIPNSQIYLTKQKVKTKFVDYINKNSKIDVNFKKDILTIGFARRFIKYKDAEMIFSDIEKLKKLGSKIQIVFAGKSHANDGEGKAIIKRILSKSEELKDFVSIAFIENYSIDIAKKLVSGCDIWLNTPIPPNEASGTSGMKAVVNGTLHFSRLDGWAIEAFEKNGGGFPIVEKEDFYSLLEYKIIPIFYDKNKTSWINEMKLSIGNSGSYFNTQRVVEEYFIKAYKINK